jgi:hypothetical protein
LEAIRTMARLSGTPVNARHLSFVFAPRLNAPGRISRPKPSLEILCETARDRAAQLALVLESDNDRRRDLTTRVEEDAVAAIRGFTDLNARGGFVLANAAWDEGVLGIAAARVVEQFGRPAILMSRNHDVLKGSGRSVPGVDLKQELDHFHDRLLRYGGHAGAVGLTMAPATESIMGALPRAKAGVGSAVNDTTRQVGGALGVAVVGSVLASTYSNQVAEFLRGKGVPTGLAHTIEHSPLGFALQTSSHVSGLAGLDQVATNAFIDGMHSGLLVAAGAALLGSLIALVFLPARPPRDSEDAQHAASDEAVVRAATSNGGVAVPEPVMEG